MDPTIKVIKGGNNDNKSTGGGGITMAVRFNAGDEQIEDILIKPSSTPIATTTTTTTTTSSIDFSPIQNIEDFNWRKEFLSSNFFHRKRSGSIEGDQRNNINSNINISSSSSPNSSIINNLSNNDTTNAVGTWKLIKGKVSQAMEDINWPKNQSQQQQQQQQHSLSTKSYPSNNDDSDLDSTINSSISDELSLDTPSQSVIYTGQNQQQQQQQSQILNKINQQQKLFNFNRINNKSDSESDIDQDVLTIDDYEPSTIRKSLANLRSKAKSSLINNDNNYNNNNNNNKKDDNNLITSNTIRNPFLRKRKKHDNDQINLTNTIINNIPSNNITTDKENINEKDIIIDKKLNDNNKNININNNNKKKNKRHFENIESGIEMFEDMIIIDKKDLLNNKNIINESIINDKLINNNGCEDGLLKISLNNDTIIYKNNNNNNNSGCVNQINNNNNDNNNSNDNNNINNNINIKNNIIKNSNLFIIFIFLFILILIPINDFLRGIITCLFTIQLFNIIWEYIKIYIDYKLNPSLNNINNSINDDNNCFGNGNGPEKIKFEIPNYNKMKYFELSSNIEEHKPLKSYSGWMNEINNYDPANYHISLTRSVYIRLDGSILRISNTSTRIPKRSMWNEHNIDRKNIIFTSNRCFNLLGCRVEMLPRGLARKRYFSRKYPIQLVIKNHDKLSATNNLEDDLLKNSIFEKALRLTTQQIESGKIISGSISNNEHFNETIINKDCSNLDNNGISNELNDEQRNNNSDYQLSNDFDFSTIILNSDLQKLSENQNLLPNNNNNNTNKNLLPCGDETRILLFARDDREKEDWYRRFYSASIGAINDQELCISDIVMISDDDIAQAVKATTKTINDSELTTTADITNLPENIDNPSTSKLLKNSSKTIKKNNTISSNNTTTTDNNILINDYFSEQQQNNDIDGQATIFEGLLLSSCSARNPQEYIKFMSRYQKACSQSNIPVVKTSLIPTDSSIKRNRRQKRQEDELWKGIDQTLYLGPCGSVVWANVLIGRILFSCLNDTILLGRIQEFLQKKLSAIRLPSFMEDVSIAQVHLGDTPPLIHRISQPQLDERGIWIDADVTYEGLMHMTITTKLNLLRLKRSQQHQQTSSINHHNKSSSSSNIGGNTNKLNTTQSTTITASNPSIINQNGNNNRNSITTPTKQNNINNGNIDITSNIINNENLEPNNYNLLIDDNNCGNNTINLNENNDNSINYNSSINNNYNEPIITTTTTTTTLPNSAIYDSNAESSGASSSDSESPTPIGSFDSTLTTNDSQGFHHPAPGSSRRLLRIVDRITASNLFQSATEISYIQRAMENMSTKITLRVELKGLVSRVVINIPPPPSDRIWIAFRGPPRLWISAKPAVGDHTFDWSIVTNVIENKLCDEVYKYLVYPNMVDIIVPFLGQSTYKEE